MYRLFGDYIQHKSEKFNDTLFCMASGDPLKTVLTERFITLLYVIEILYISRL